MDGKSPTMHLKKILPFLILLLAACSGMKKPASEPKKPLILVSIAPYQMMVQRVAGENFAVETVVPPNANPHSYEPTSRQVSGLNKGRVWFQIGEPFEQKLKPLLPQTKTIDLREGVSMIGNENHHCESCGHDHLDRHIWLSPKQALLQVDLIAKTLAEQFPADAEGIQERAALLRADLERLDRDIAAILTGVNARSFLVSHPAFAYFCRDYDLQQLSVEQEGKDPRPKELEAVYQSAMQSQAEVAIALPQHNNKGAQLIAEKLRIPVRMIDPYSSEYFDMMLQLAGSIAHPYQTNE